MVRPRPVRPSHRLSFLGKASAAAVRNIALCVIALSVVLLISAYAFLFGLSDRIPDTSVPSKANAELVVPAATASTGDQMQKYEPKRRNDGGLRPRNNAVALNLNEGKDMDRGANPKASEKVKATIGYVVSITGCPGGNDDPLTDGAAVLKHSIHLQSASNPASGSRYGYKMYAIAHPDATECAEQLSEMGYEMLVRDVPVPVEEIKGDFLRTKVVVNGCCGEKEYIKLHAYTILEHSVVVHLDLDTIVLKPLDQLFDAMLNEDNSVKEKPSSLLPIMFDKPLPPRVDAFFTRDYNMVKASKKHVGVQGGFLVLRPSMETYHNYEEIIREGNFVEGKGWGGLGFGPFYGSLTFQGIVPYYYDELHPNTAVELNRCYYNSMADNPRDQKTVNDVVSGNCRDGRDDCEDCREIDITMIFTAHFTLCQKPWSCLPHSQDQLQHRLCRKLHHAWFRVRADYEGKSGEGQFDPDHFYGFCNHSGGPGYIPIKVNPEADGIDL